MSRASLHKVLAAVLLFSIAGCANHYGAATVDEPYGFWSGFWHGMIFLFSMIGVAISWLGSLAGLEILESVTIIGRPNTGWTYYLGFALGALTSSSSTAQR
jgi:hypothetical protein